MRALGQRLSALPRPEGAKLGWWVRELSSGEELGVDGKAVFRTASLIKLPIALTVFRHAEAGALSLDERIELDQVLTEDDSGILSRLRPGDASLSLRALVALMLCVSDNTASNLLIERVGMGAVNAELDALGLQTLRLRRRLLDFAAAARGEENVGNAYELASLVARLATGDLLSPSSTSELMAMLRQNAMSMLRRELPHGAWTADKTGDLPGFRASAGVLESGGNQAAVSVLLESAADEAAAERFIAAFGREIATWLQTRAAPAAAAR